MGKIMNKILFRKKYKRSKYCKKYFLEKSEAKKKQKIKIKIYIILYNYINEKYLLDNNIYFNCYITIF